MHVPPPHPARQHSLGRILFFSWRDKANPLYHCLAAHLKDETHDANQLRQHCAATSSALVHHISTKFQRALDALRTRGIAYDPREAGAVMPYGEAGALAREAQKAWRQLQETEAQKDDYMRTMDGLTERQRVEAAELLRRTEVAWTLHEKFMCGALRYALRWRVVGKTVVFKVRWVRKVLRPFRALGRG